MGEGGCYPTVHARSRRNPGTGFLRFWMGKEGLQQQVPNAAHPGAGADQHITHGVVTHCGSIAATELEVER